jgi:hypothetical protein
VYKYVCLGSDFLQVSFEGAVKKTHEQKQFVKMLVHRLRVREVSLLALVLTIMAGGVLIGCGDDNGIQPGTVRFGQIGEVRITLVVPLLFNDLEGELQQILTWNSTGAWQLKENISYRYLEGDEDLTQNPEAAGSYAASYATFITELNEAEGLTLFTDELPRELDPLCGPGETEILFLIRDDVRVESVSWKRCTEGSFSTLETSSAGPDDGAVRLVQAAILARDWTLGPDYEYAYQGSVPYGTLDRGEDSGAELPAPVAFYSEEEGLLETPEGWVSFWRDHTGSPTAQPPVVDWAHEMVLVAASGKRTEAGDSIEFRRILQTGENTQVTLFERLPGNFCSPASRDHYPVHIVVSPRTLLPIQFRDFVEELVPCGL